MKPVKSAFKYTSLIIVITAILSEGIGMLILHQTQTPHNNLVLLDSMLLVVLLAPVLFFFVYRPLNTSVKKIDRLNREKDKIIKELTIALDEIKTLRGIIPICASCKKIRDDKEHWYQLETYIQNHSDADFSHGICPECAEKLYPEFKSYRPEE